MTLRWTSLIAAFAITLHATAALATERYALIVTGASGGAPYAEKYALWRQTLVDTLEKTFEYPADHVVVLADEAGPAVRVANRDNVRDAIAAFRQRMTADDVLAVILIGHGSGADGDAPKFNLVGPDLSAAEWGALFRGMAGQLIFVNTSSGSFPFLEALAGRNRVVVTANDSPQQQFETVFPEYFVAALGDASADTDKNGRVSIWEAFAAAGERVRRYFQEKGQLATERPLLDDNGDGAGREPGAPGVDGVLSRVVYLQPDPAIADTGDPVRTALLRRRAQLSNELEQLRAKKEEMAPDQYENALEKLLIEFAQIERRLRAGS